MPNEQCEMKNGAMRYALCAMRLTPTAFLVFLAAPTRTGLVAANLGRTSCRLSF